MTTQDKLKKLQTFSQNKDLAKFDTQMELVDQIETIRQAIENIRMPEFETGNITVQLTNLNQSLQSLIDELKKPCSVTLTLE